MIEINLNTKISEINRLSKEHIIGLQKLNINTVKDLLYYFPARYSDDRESKNIQNIQKGEAVTLFGEIKNLEIKRSFKGHIPMCEAKLVDATGYIKLVWFHQAYIAKMYEEGEFVKVSGIVQEKNEKYSILNPNIERVSRDHIFYENSIFGDIDTSTSSANNTSISSATNTSTSSSSFRQAQGPSKELLAVYKETKGLSSNYLRSLIKKIIQEYKILDYVKNLDPIPKHILDDLHLPSLEKAFLYIHLPKADNLKKTEEQVLVARKRFSFEEIFYLQVLKQIEKKKAKDSLGYNIKNSDFSTDISEDFISKIELKFNFKLTNSQLEAIKNISNDLQKSEPMGRLLEGDVGSGKTLVAIIIAYLITHNINRDTDTKKRLQIAYMAPTEVLASQHFESFINFLKDENIEIGLITGKTCKKFPSKIDKNLSTNISKNQLKKWIESGDISIVIGTHSLLNEKIKFQNLALAIIDEQHRFGVKQRAKLANKKSVSVEILPANHPKNITNKRQEIKLEKDKLPHLLSMTATPIPRTLALTIFGDLDLTVIDEMPKNRKKIITKLCKESERNKIYEEIKKEILSGYQVYVIVPRIDELDEEELQSAQKLNLRSIASEIKSLEKYFKTYPQPLRKEGVKVLPLGKDLGWVDKTINIFGIHSKLKKEEKENIMKDFYENKIQILVSTSVVEVGVNVPNASRMIIEGAERFGLAQLHQLRGRIGRGERESVCYIFSNSNSDITSERMSSLLKAKNGFELAELDLNQRGIGSLLSGKQWGVSDLAMEAIKNLKLVEIAREEAKKIIEKDESLKDYKLLKDIVEDKEKAHME